MAHRRSTADHQKYYGSVRSDLIDLVEGTGLRVLEIGCGEGETSAALLEAGIAAEVVGIEHSPEVAERARTRLTTVLEGDVEHLDLSGIGSFDLVIMGDVLEHLVDPWALLRRVRLDLLAPDGVVLASIPNVRCIMVWGPLVVAGRFTYRESGLLDRTHLRWFTRRTILHMFQDAGLDARIVGTRRLLDSKGRVPTLVMRPFGDHTVQQFLVRATKPGSCA